MKRFVVASALSAFMAASSAQAFDIVIDPGHGGADPGAVGCGLEEHDINLDIGLRLRDLLTGSGQTVGMTRTTNVSVALSGRSDFANSRGADRFVSLHNNAFNGTATGTETFCDSLNAATQGFDQASKIQSEVVATFGLTNRGVKNGGSSGTGFSVIVNTNMPATLSELAFVDNCSVDATILGNPTKRQDGAEAHLAALAAHLGFTVDGDPVEQNGELKGVVFEDDGTGLAGIADAPRLGGATVRVVGRADTTTSAADTGSWTFTLPAGTYRVHAEAAGHITAERDCDVLDAGGVRFCSIGLLVDNGGGGEGEGEEGEGEGEGAVGEGEGEEGEGEGGVEGEGEGGVEGEGEGGTAGIERVVIRNKPGASGGCGASDVGSVSAVALAGLLLLRRRRAFAGLAALFALSLSSSASAAPSWEAKKPLPVLPAKKKLVDEQVVLKAVTSSVAVSPSGETLLLSDDHYEGLTTLVVKSRKQTTLSTAKRAGFRAVWLDEAHVAHRVPNAPFGGQPLIELDAATGAFVGPVDEDAKFAVVQGKDDVVRLGERVDDAGNLKNARALSPSDDQCFAPLVSHLKGDLVVVYQCLQSGLWLHRGKETFRLGQGAQPAFSVDGSALVYVVAADEGHVIVEADLVFVDLTTKTPTQEVFETARVERAPGVGNARADGSRVVAFVVDNDVTVATLR